MHYDEIYRYVGEMGRYQILSCVAIFFFSLFSIDAVNMIFLGADMPHWCAVPELAHLPHHIQKHLSIPILNAEGQVILDDLDLDKELDQTSRVLRHVISDQVEGQGINLGQGYWNTIGHGINIGQGQNNNESSKVGTDRDKLDDLVPSSSMTIVNRDRDLLTRQTRALMSDKFPVRENSGQEIGTKVNSRRRRSNQNDLEITTVPDIDLSESEMEKPETKYSSCEMYARNYSVLLEELRVRYGEEGGVEGWENASLGRGGIIVECESWVYDRSTFMSTIISRFDLVCGLKSLNQLSSTLFMSGQVLGGIVSGLVADRFGRKFSSLVFILVKILGTCLGAWGPHYWVFALGRFILGVGSSACFVNMYILLMEIVGPRYRSFAGCGIQVATSVGFMLQPLIAMATRHDVTFQITYIPCNILVFILCLFVPESPRWLIVAGRYSRADRVFTQMCRVNGTRLPENFSSKNIEKDDAPKGHYALLLKYPRMRLRSCIMNFVWFTSTMIYYAMALNVGYLPGNIFINTLLSATLEVPAIILCLFLLDWHMLGRKGCSVWSFGITAVCLFLCIPLDLLGYGVGVTALNVVGKAVAVVTYSVLFVYASEIFPTEVRNSAMGVAQMFASISSVASPYVGQPMTELWRPLPYVVLGTLAIISALVCLPLPETFQQSLCDTVAEAEAFTGRQKEKKTKSRTNNRTEEDFLNVNNEFLPAAASAVDDQDVNTTAAEAKAAEFESADEAAVNNVNKAAEAEQAAEDSVLV